MFGPSHLLMPIKGLLIIGANEAQNMPDDPECKKYLNFFQLFPDTSVGTILPEASVRSSPPNEVEVRLYVAAPAGKVCYEVFWAPFNHRPVRKLRSRGFGPLPVRRGRSGKF